MKLKDKVAIVTGGGRGLGRGIALAYAQEGAHLALVARGGDEIEQVAQEVRDFGQRALPIQADLTKEQDVQAMVTKTLDEFGTIDILVNNVGGYRLYTDSKHHQVFVKDLTVEEWDRVINVNLRTAFLCCKAVIETIMAKKSGVIINLTSGVADKGRSGGAAYSAAKSAVERLTESLAEELKEFNIAVNSLNPGWNLTRPNEDYDPEVWKRMRMPEDIGPSALFLALQTPETMTGQVLSAPEYDKAQGIVRPSAFERIRR
ncbi:MAG: SDR family oxidoreductase [Candidatus Tectomicrobia bacterium]|nr:SDR family oxidoreductase [Candidatus Tectomicrobia bacterium]